MRDHAGAVERVRAQLRGDSAAQREYPGHAAAAVLLVNRGGVTEGGRP